jgi:hypothetical protein
LPQYNIEGYAMNQQPQTFDYIEEAHKTASNQFHGDMVPYAHFCEVMARVIAAINELDAIKKTIFYGKQLPDFHIKQAECKHSLKFVHFHLVDDDTTPAQAKNIIHGIIGKATESGELLEALAACMMDGVSFDKTNCLEEVGDGMWYDALIAKACGFNFGEAQTVNIEKLRARFPHQFAEADAVNRNLAVERAILEQQPKDGHEK